MLGPVGSWTLFDLGLVAFGGQLGVFNNPLDVHYIVLDTNSDFTNPFKDEEICVAHSMISPTRPADTPRP